MTMPTLAEICDAVAATLSTAAGLNRSQSYDELTETPVDLPLLQVYWDEEDPDLQSYGSIRVERIVINADLYARSRSQINEDMAKTTTMAEAILTVLRAQKPTTANTLFGVSYFVKFNWSAKRAKFNEGQGKPEYMGTRFVLTFWVKG